MPKAFSVRQAQAVDKFTIEKIGIPSIVLMENAGRLIAAEISKVLQTKQKKNVVIFCGCGNNGGDGFVVARHLWSHGIKVKVFLIGTPQQLKRDPAVNYQILKKLKYPVKNIQRLDKKVLAEMNRATVIVDAMFGIGLSRAVGEPYKSIFTAINQARKFVVAVDVPSGLDATTGKILGDSIKASLTVTFAVLKKGFCIGQGKQCAGKVLVADIGIPKIAEKIIESREVF